MRDQRINGTVYGVLFAICAMTLLLTSSVLAAGTWVDEIANMMAYEKDSNPGSNFDPYFAQLNKIQAGVSGGDQPLVKKETDHFLKMLANRHNGIHDVAADEIYNFALMVRPMEEPSPTVASELGTVNERPMSVPDHTINTPYEGGPKCPAGGCDYWQDNVFDPGAS